MTAQALTIIMVNVLNHQPVAAYGKVMPTLEQLLSIFK